jgi:L-Ala-D/L-Glu epimerase
MASIHYNILDLEKRVPLTIARGTRTHSTLVWLRWRQDEIEGWGEAVPLDVGNYSESVDDIVAAFSMHRKWLSDSSAHDRKHIEDRLRAEKAPSAFMAGINQALLDWTGKWLGQPVWQVLGLSQPNPGPITSVTVGISPPEGARVRVRQWREVGDVRAFKIKLGSPAGIKADQAMFEAARSEIGLGNRISVDANGGWSVDDACRMATWLAERGVDHLEQPLPRGQESHLFKVRDASALPVIVDESCLTSDDIPDLVGCADGVNIKLMKCGGLDEALRMVTMARTNGLKILVGCYGNSALGNTAGATLGSCVDYLDLDSHLNLRNDPFQGASFRAGRLNVSSSPGFGISHE